MQFKALPLLRGRVQRSKGCPRRAEPQRHPGGSEGELDGSWDRVNKAKNYEVQISDDPPSSNSWRAGDIVSASRVTLTGLTSGAKIWMRVRALGPKGLKSPWSDPAVKRVP